MSALITDEPSEKSEAQGGTHTLGRLRRRVWVMIIVSLIWALGAGVHTHNADLKNAEDFAQFVYETCIDGKNLNHDANVSACDIERQGRLKNWGGA